MFFAGFATWLPLPGVCLFVSSLSDDSLWNAADDDTIPDPAGHKRRFQGLHNTGWLWSTGDHTTGKHTLGALLRVTGSSIFKGCNFIWPGSIRKFWKTLPKKHCLELAIKVSCFGYIYMYIYNQRSRNDASLTPSVINFSIQVSAYMLSQARTLTFLSTKPHCLCGPAFPAWRRHAIKQYIYQRCSCKILELEELRGETFFLCSWLFKGGN